MPKRIDSSPVTDGFDFDGAKTLTVKNGVTKILPDQDNKVDLGSPSKKFKNIYYESLTPDPGVNYLPLAGGTMSGNINMGNNDLKEVSAIRFPVASTKVVVGGSSTAGASAYDTVIGVLSTIDGSSISATSVGYGNTVTTSVGATALGSAQTVSNSSGAVVLGNTAKGVNAASGVAVGDHAETNSANSVVIGGYAVSNANAAHCIGSSITNTTANSLLLDASANVRSNATTCDLGTTSKPFQNLYLNGFALNSNPSHRMPVSRFAMTDAYGQFGLNTVETSFIGGSSTGSLTIPGPTAPGFSCNLSLYYLFQAGAATTFTIRLKVNGSTICTTTIPAGTAVNQTCKLEHAIQLWTPASGTRLYIGVKLDRHLAMPILYETLADNVWLPNGDNTLSLTGQFSDNNGLCAPRNLELTTSYAS